MRVLFLVAAYNEQQQISRICDRLLPIASRFSRFQIYLLDNGSTDMTWEECLKMQNEHPQIVRALHCAEAGMGNAFRMGLEAISSEALDRNDWIVLAAADLPFGLSDLEGVVKRQMGNSPEDIGVYIGSKAHPDSKVVRNFKRTVGSQLFYLLRRLILGLQIKDTQGSIIVRGDTVAELKKFRSNDYFFAVELLERAVRFYKVAEVPVILESEKRPSRVHLFSDGWRMLKQLILYRISKIE